jgi:hypothetical protein
MYSQASPSMPARTLPKCTVTSNNSLILTLAPPTHTPEVVLTDRPLLMRYAFEAGDPMIKRSDAKVQGQAVRIREVREVFTVVPLLPRQAPETCWDAGKAGISKSYCRKSKKTRRQNGKTEKSKYY